MSVVHGPRGGGKSYLSALGTHIDSQYHDLHGTKILGGSLAQSSQIYSALKEFDRVRPGAISSFTKTHATYGTGSEVSILAASATSVRGPHVATLRLDEVDEIAPEIRDAALGMCMAQRGVSAMVAMTSTWHNVAGPMGDLRQRADAGDIPWWTFCAFEVLECCPSERSGPYVGGDALYARCPECPLKRWCHAERDLNGNEALAKLSDGHYAIDSLIQKVASVSPRVFEADYLCLGPKADGVWFTSFDESRHVSEDADYDPRLPVHLAIDSGVFTGAVWFQVGGSPGCQRVNVFADHLCEGIGAETVARDLLATAQTRCEGRKDRVSTDVAGSSRTASGPTVVGEYERVGLVGSRRGSLEFWPRFGGSVRASLDLLDAFLTSADGRVSLTIHPRCKSLIEGMRSYRRAKRSGQWQDYPEDPQHPHEDLVDALRGGLLLEFPEGRRPQPMLQRVPARRVF